MAKKLSGRTKERYEYLKIISKKKKGRTKENNEVVRIAGEKQSETKKGRSKYNNEGVRKQSEWMKKEGSKRANSFPRKHIGPNKPETLILNVLERRYPNEWKYTGNNGVWFGDSNPDFMNINGRKLLIEHFGTYWHSEQVKKVSKKQHEDNVIQNYKNYGYETLIIWENELKDMEKVERRISEFMGQGEDK